MYTSIDIVLDNLERQIRKNKTKLQKKYQALETIRFEKISEPVEEEEPKIVRVKNFDVATMSEEEAILQIELLNHDFFIFKMQKIQKLMFFTKEKTEITV